MARTGRHVSSRGTGRGLPAREAPGSGDAEGVWVEIRTLLEADRRAAARIYVAGLLDEEVRPLMPRHLARAERVFAELIQPGVDSWVAEAEGRDVVGLALCQEPCGPPPSMIDWHIYRRNLPFVAAVRAKFVANYLYRVGLAEDAMYLQSLVVARGWEGRGVGSALVQFVCSVARERGYGSLALNVVDVNRRARRLYEYLGFSEVRSDPAGFYRPLVGWGAVDLMEKKL